MPFKILFKQIPVFVSEFCVILWLLFNLADSSWSSSSVLDRHFFWQFWALPVPYRILINYILELFLELLFLQMIFKSQPWDYLNLMY